jgi:hypothetical protein
MQSHFPTLVDVLSGEPLPPLPVLRHSIFGALTPTLEWSCAAVPLAAVPALQAVIGAVWTAAPYALALLPPLRALSGEQRATIVTAVGGRPLPWLCGYQSHGMRLVVDMFALYYTVRDAAAAAAWAATHAAAFESVDMPPSVFRVGFDWRDGTLPATAIVVDALSTPPPSWCTALDVCLLLADEEAC